MVKLSTVVLAIAGALVGLSSADNCKDGLYYCGYNLLSKGNYYDEIVAELQSENQSTDSDHVNQSLFSCGGDGVIKFSQYCGNGCHDGGSGKSDWCT